MSDTSSSEGLLYRLYAKYVGEPRSRTDAYGFWIFILGYVLGTLGILGFILQVASGPPTQPLVLEASFLLAALALPLALTGVGLVLPIRRQGIQVAALGTAIAVVGVVWFSTLYPQSWSARNPDVGVMGLYGIGVAIVAGVVALIPVVTGERSALIETETGAEAAGDQSQVLLGETVHGALFAVFNTGAQWTWRLIEEEAIADTQDQYLTRLETEDRVETVKSQIADAGMLEIRGAAFRLYETDSDLWRWVLMREGGDVVADGGSDFASRDAAEESVNLLKEYGPNAEPLTVDGAAFDYYRDGGRWRWRLVDESRDGLAASPGAYAAKDEAVKTATVLRDAVVDAEILRIDGYAVELYEQTPARNEPESPPTEADGGNESAWRWRMLDAADSQIVSGSATYESRNAVETAAYDLLESLAEAPVLEAGEPIYEISPHQPDGWRWRLVGPGAATVARGHEDGVTRTEAESAAKMMRETADTADVFVIEGVEFEVYTDDTGWRWRLADEDRNVVAVGDEQYQDRESAAEAVERVRGAVPKAELIEFENAAFQIYEAGEQPAGPEGEKRIEWRWRLIDEDGDVLADSGDDYGTRDQALNSMNTLKQYAPDADLLEIDTAAFELYDDGAWYWRLIDESGDLIARSGTGYPSRQAARLSMDRVIDSAPDTDSRYMGNAGFQICDEGDAWHWRLVLPSNRTIAHSAGEYSTRDQTVAAIEDLRSDAAEAGITTIKNAAIKVVESDGIWRWRIVDAARDPLADGDRTYSDRDRLDAEIGGITSQASDIIVFEIDGYVFRVRGAEQGWEWQLIDEDRTTVARSVDPHDAEKAVRQTIDRVRRLAPDAGAIDYDPAAFELRETSDQWGWQLIDTDEHVIASGTETYDSRGETVDELEIIKSAVEGASIFEIDTAAFELQEDDDGWRWRLVDDNGNVIGYSRDNYKTRGGAREGLRTGKQMGPGAPTAVAEYE